MTKEKINMAIAEYCGWASTKMVYGDPMGRPPNTTDEFRIVPNYFENLDLIFSAEKFLKEDDDHASACYNVELLEKFGYTVSISAADRAKMFVKVIGRWEYKE